MCQVKMKTLLVCAGLGYLLLFVLQGQYMAIFQGGLQGYPDGQRMLLRSAHIYAMLCSLPAIFMGLYLPDRALRWHEHLASGVFLLAPLVMFLGYFIESNQSDTLERPMIRFTLIVIFFVCAALPLLHALGQRRSDRPEDEASS
jgi:hypothetical protein